MMVGTIANKNENHVALSGGLHALFWLTKDPAGDQKIHAKLEPFGSAKAKAGFHGDAIFICCLADQPTSSMCQGGFGPNA